MLCRLLVGLRLANTPRLFLLPNRALATARKSTATKKMQQTSMTSFFKKVPTPEKPAKSSSTSTTPSTTPEKPTKTNATPDKSPKLTSKTPSPPEKTKGKKRKADEDEEEQEDVEVQPPAAKKAKDDPETSEEKAPTPKKAFSFSGDDLIDDEALLNMDIPATAASSSKAPATKPTPVPTTPSKPTTTTTASSSSTPFKSPVKPASIFSSPGSADLPPSVQALGNLLTEESWRTVLKSEFKKQSFANLAKFMDQEKAIKNNKLYPPENLIFNALNQSTFEKARVVILGQDPYIYNGQAMGMSFSVPRGVTPPPSLKSIFKELSDDIPDFQVPNHGDLTAWAQQGVLLLNAVLTVRHGESNSHKGKGWEQITDAIINAINTKKEGVVFMLWGKDAQMKAASINTKKHLVLKAAHPSPKSADRGFFGCKHFSKANAYLKEHGEDPIDWKL